MQSENRMAPRAFFIHHGLTNMSVLNPLAEEWKTIFFIVSNFFGQILHIHPIIDILPELKLTSRGIQKIYHIFIVYFEVRALDLVG